MIILKDTTLLFHNLINIYFFNSFYPNRTHSEIAQSSNVHCRSSSSSIQKVFNSSNCNFKDSQIDTPESSSKQVELEAKLEEVS